jgi:citrate synthase
MKISMSTAVPIQKNDENILNETKTNIKEGIGVQLSTARSAVSTIYPLAHHKANKIFIRNCSLLDETSGLVYQNYEEVLYLLLHHHQPDSKEFYEFKKEIRQHLSAHSTISQLFLEIDSLENKPLILLQILLFSLSYEDKLSSTAIIARAFTLVANIFNKYVGRPLIACRPDLGLIENLLYMIGKNYTDSILVKHFTKMMIAWMELGLAPSAIATRVNASSRTDVISALVAGVGNMTGERHTSARIKCMRLLKSINQEFQAIHPLKNNTIQLKKIIQGQLQAILDKEERVPGFGHRIFRNLDDDGIDPRISLVEEAIKELYGHDNDLLSIVFLMRELFEEGQLLRNGKPLILPPNSDMYWSVFLYYFFEDYQPKNMDAIASLLTILTRMSGLLAHYEEQRQMSDTMRGWGCYK